jgi:hypothetical protein
VERKTPEEIAEAIDEAYGDSEIGPEISEILVKMIKAAKYTDAEIEEVRAQIRPFLKEMRRLRRAS